MIEKYVESVTKRLPDNLKKETEEKIRSLIKEKANEINKDLPEEEKINEALRILGNPEDFEEKYMNKKRYLIGPENFYNYKVIMKIVVIAIFIAISVSSGISVVFFEVGIEEFIRDYIESLISALLQSVAWVTGIFAFLEYKEIELKKVNIKGNWDAKQLKEDKSLISKKECIINIFVTTILLPFFLFGSKQLPLYLKDGGKYKLIEIVNLDVLKSFNFLIILIFSLIIIENLIKLIEGRWSLRLTITTSIISLLTSGLIIRIIVDDNLWNKNVIKALNVNIPISFDKAIGITVFTIIIITLIGVAIDLYKGLKYK